MNINECIFCRIVQDKEKNFKVFEDDASIAFLDKRPVMLGHCLLIPKAHIETFYNLQEPLVKTFFINAQKLGRAIERGMHAQGSFIGLNNIISQSVPHCHLHIIPRNKSDGLRGFFWPRKKYNSEQECKEVQNAIKKFL
jgi:histidine triad (HIT) family protein